MPDMEQVMTGIKQGVKEAVRESFAEACKARKGVDVYGRAENA
jgi:hypothetical protein